MYESIFIYVLIYLFLVPAQLFTLHFFMLNEISLFFLCVWQDLERPPAAGAGGVGEVGAGTGGNGAGSPLSQL